MMKTNIRCLILLLALLAGVQRLDAQGTPVAAVSAQIAQAENDLRAVNRALDRPVDADERGALRARALAAQQAARSAAGQLQDQLALVDARVAGLGPAEEGVAEAPEIRRQRAQLAQERATLDAAIKRGRLSDVEAQQFLDEIDRSQAEQLNETLFTPVASPVSPAFWRSLVAALPRDLRRIDLLGVQGMQEIGTGARGRLPWPALLGLGLAVLLMVPVRLLGRRVGRRYLIGSAPGHRVRRSAFAIWTVLVGTVTPLLAAVALVQGLRWAGLAPDRWSGLFDGFVVASGFAAFTASLAGAVLMRRNPSWRVAPIGDATADRVRPLSWLLAMLAFANIMVEAFNRAAGASRAAIVTTEVVAALLYLLLVAAFLLLLGRLRTDTAERPDADSQSTSTGLGVVTLAAWLLVGLAVLSLAIGYVGLSLFVARLIVWGLVLGAALYLLMHAVDDAATSLFNRDSKVGGSLVRSVGLRGSLVDQFGLLLSAALRIALVLLALGMLLSPFGAGGLGSLFGRLGSLAQGLDIGGIAISPGTILRSLAVLLVGLALVRAFLGWLDRRYLPATDLDGSGRNSVSLVARYVGIALAVIWALASLGIGVERIALLLSALSVGIGFGLQAITQNFVSGLILLAERPIKIGDWIRVGTDEGDVKRISVRSTEIALPDHSTLIVPNSELITKSVLNKTLASPLGRIQVQFSVPLGEDVVRIRAILFGLFAAEPQILDDPAPVVFVDAIADGRILFNSFAHVPSPRQAYGARSDLFLALLDRFRAEGIDIGTVPQRLELAPAAGLPDRGGSDATNVRDAGSPDPTRDP